MGDLGKMKPQKFNRALTLIEIMISLLLVAIGIIGAMMFRYYSASNARLADVHAGAGKVGLLVLEGWKGNAGNLSYDPSSDVGPEVLGCPDITIGAIDNGIYPVQLTGGVNTYYYVRLTYSEDVDGDGSDDPGIRKLMVEVTYYGWGSQNNTLPSKTVKIGDFVRT